MIKRIYYYFKLKKLLKRKGLILFVEFILENWHTDDTLFRFCMNRNRYIPWWLDELVRVHLRTDAFDYKLGNKTHAEGLIKRYNQARDFWHKNVKL